MSYNNYKKKGTTSMRPKRNRYVSGIASVRKHIYFINSVSESNSWGHYLENGNIATR